jgi:hypothetical protein
MHFEAAYQSLERLDALVDDARILSAERDADVGGAALRISEATIS